MQGVPQPSQVCKTAGRHMVRASGECAGASFSCCTGCRDCVSYKQAARLRARLGRVRRRVLLLLLLRRVLRRPRVRLREPPQVRQHAAAAQAAGRARGRRQVRPRRQVRRLRRHTRATAALLAAPQRRPPLRGDTPSKP